MCRTLLANIPDKMEVLVRKTIPYNNINGGFDSTENNYKRMIFQQTSREKGGWGDGKLKDLGWDMWDMWDMWDGICVFSCSNLSSKKSEDGG